MTSSEMMYHPRMTSSSSSQQQHHVIDDCDVEVDVAQPLAYDELLTATRLMTSSQQPRYDYVTDDDDVDSSSTDDVINYTIPQPDHARSYSSLLAAAASGTAVVDQYPWPSVVTTRPPFHPNMYLPVVHDHDHGTASAARLDTSGESPFGGGDQLLAMSSLSDLDNDEEEEEGKSLLVSGGRRDVTNRDTNV